LEDIRVRLDDMGSSIPENQFMIHILNNLTADYDLQLALLEKRIGDKERPLTVDEIRAELSLRFERLTMKSARNEDGEVLEERALLAVSLKVNAEIVDRLGTSHFSAKIVQTTMMQITVIRLQEIIALTAVRRVISSLTV